MLCYKSMSTLLKNKKAYFDYEVLEHFEAGIELFGFEVKALRKKQGSLEGAYIIIRGNEAFLVGTHIPPYQVANTPDGYDPNRVRKLLLHQKEIQQLIGLEKQRNLTIVPLSVYNKARKLKVDIAIVRGKKKYDKREIIKKRESKRNIERTLKEIK